MGGGWVQKKQIANAMYEAANANVGTMAAQSVVRAAVEAKEAAEAAAAAEQTVLSASAPKMSVEAVEAPEVAMKRAATIAFTKAITDGMSKEEAKNIAREAGRKAYKAAQKAIKLQHRPQEGILLPSDAMPSPPPSHPASEPQTVRTSLFARADASPEETAAKLRAMAIEKAERLERAEKERERLKATRKRVVRSDLARGSH